jgi:hypothetical protein
MGEVSARKPVLRQQADPRAFCYRRNHFAGTVFMGWGIWLASFDTSVRRISKWWHPEKMSP